MIINKVLNLPDVSFYQGNIDFSKMGSTCILRAGQNIWIDSKFDYNRSQAVYRGMNWGIYWYYDDRVSPGVQADKIFSLFKDGQPRPNMEIWCDWEGFYGGKYGGLPNAVSFMERIELLMPWAKVGMYTGYYWFTSNSNSSTNLSQYNYLKNKPLWVAWYTEKPEDVLIPSPWTKVDFWQYTDNGDGIPYGVESLNIDLNWFNGTVEEFNTRYGGIITPPEEGAIMKGKMLNYSVNVRNSSNAIVAQLKANDVVYGSIEFTNRERIHFTKIYRANESIQDLGSLHNAVTNEGSIPFMVLTSDPEPGTVPPTGKTLTNTISVYSDGSINVISA